jgi:hypothetical protein
MYKLHKAAYANAGYMSKGELAFLWGVLSIASI